jgi:hypothetical protein
VRRLALIVALVACGADPIAPDEPTEDVDVSPSSPATGPRAAAQPTPSAAAPREPMPAGAQSFEAVVEAAEVSDEEPKRLAFRGATLRRDGDARPVVATYAASGVWRALDGLRVRVVAVPYEPEGRAIYGDHFDVLEAHLVDPKAGTTVLGFGRSQTLRGRLARVVVPKGQKAEGTSYLTFEPTSGPKFEVYELSGELAAEPPLDVELEVQAHEVELAPTMQRRGGPFLWIRSTR